MKVSSVSNGIRPQAKLTLTEQAYREIRRRILHLEYPQGAVVSERLLAESLGMGKAPIRAALIRLATEGIVTIASRQGIVITTVTIQDILELFHMRYALETLIVRELAGNLNEQQIEQLNANLEEYAASANSGIPADTIPIDFSFHRMLTEFHGNQQMLRVLDSTYDLLYREIRQAQAKFPQRIWNSIEEHRGIADAVIRGDRDLAEERMKEHLRFGEEFLLSRVRR